MECLSFFVGPVVNVFKNLWTDYITEKLSNFTSFVKRVEEMKDKMDDLERKRVDIQEHVKDNEINIRKIPTCVPKWLEDVEDIKKDFVKIPSNTDGFNLKEKYEAGEDALKLTKKIEDLIAQSKEIKWTDADIPLGSVDSKRPASASTSASASASASAGNTRIVFKSREKTFNEALKLLQRDDDDAARVIALCGMGGVGKTTLMKQLKKAAHDKKMFNWIVVVAVGNTPNLLKIQKEIAVQTGDLPTKTDLLAPYLSKRFEVLSKQEQKTLVILDDVWLDNVWEKSKIKLEDIGLASPLPNGVKLLLTSRDVKVCRRIAADSALKVVEVDVLKDNEAQDFFCLKAEISAKDDHDIYKIGCEIVQKCGYLPLAIELIAGTLKSEKIKGVWRHTLTRLKNNDLEKNVQEIIEMSYNNLKQEDKEIFLLCGLFPEYFNIPIEDLTRYAWGLKLLKHVSTMEEARDSTQTSVSNLKNAYLLKDGDRRHTECVKLHDLVLAFVVNTVSKGGDDGCWIIYHKDDFSNWSEANSMSQSCKQISLSCKGMSEFPTDFKFPDLSLLKLVQGDKSLRFPQAFYATMENLQVIAFERMKYPVVPTSSVKLRTLCLDECSLIFDLTCIGNLLNLEVLSFANSRIEILPSTFGNLKKLRLLDVTGCCDLVIDDGVLKGLVKLEELYMIPYYEEACCFTDNNSREFAERSENLKRFKLSVGCSSTEVREHVQTYKVDMHSYENSLKLVTNRKELLKSKINKLFKITNALYLQVNDINSLEDVEIPHPPRNSSFCNLRLLVVSECTELKYLFTTTVAKILSKLESLYISRCPIMEAVIHTGMLKPPKLKILKIQGCNLLKHIFTFSSLESLTQLEELEVKDCKEMEVIVAEESEELTASDAVVFPHLKSLVLVNLPNFEGFFLGKNEFIWPALEKVVICGCPQITVFTYGRSTTPKLNNFINSSLGKHSVECGLNFHVTTTSYKAQLPSYETTSSYRPTTMERLPWSYHNLIEVDMYNYNPSGGQALFSSNAVSQLQKLETVRVRSCDDIWEIFDSQTDAEIPNLREVDLGYLLIRYIWKSKRGTVLKFPNLTKLSIDYCFHLDYVFTCPMVGSLLQLQELRITRCEFLGPCDIYPTTGMEVIVKGEEECDATVVLPCLKSIKLVDLGRLEGFCSGKEAFEFPSLDTLQIDSCPQMTVFTKGDLSTPKLQEISIEGRKYNIHNKGLNSFLNSLNKRD